MPSILVIDDSRLVAEKVRGILAPYAIDVHHASSAAEVFGYRGAPSLLRELTPDLILLDIMMPVMSGFDTLIRLQAHVKARDIPVIMFSASSNEYNVLEAVNRGAKAFISKPLIKDKMLETIARVARDAERYDLARCLAEYLDGMLPSADLREDLKVGAADLNYLLELMDDDEDMLRHLVEVFIQDLPDQIDQIDQAVETGHADNLRRAAHLFKGSISNFGAAKLTERALKLEIMGRGGDLEDAAKLFAPLKKDAEHLRAQLISWLAF